MSQETKPKAPLSIEGAIILPYRYAAGGVMSRFLIALRDSKKTLGIRCSRCNMVYVPPRETCLHCFGRMDEWVELEGSGTVESYTVVRYSLPVHPMAAPFAFALIKLDGADTSLTHLLGEIDLEKIKVGMKVEPVYSESRKASILDISYFRPAN
ncbi:MAG: Zn-ribbon domain-containing OB-fold protein [Chloroflexi bacterium]|nr:Zn-ribbon domain-containing OB-fold protein [Chloroflexota bacterium]